MSLQLGSMKVKITLPELSSISFANTLTGWVGGLNGILLKTEDGGSNWSIQHTPITSGPIHSLWFVDSKIGWIAGWDSQLGTCICRTHDGGKSWELSLSSNRLPRTKLSRELVGIIREEHLEDAVGVLLGEKLPGIFNGMFFLNQELGWLVGANSVLMTTDGGRSWRSQVVEGCNIETVFFLDSSTGWIAGEKGKIYKTSDGGESWRCQRDTAGHINSLFMISRDIGWAVGNSGLILSTNDGGKHWVPRNIQSQKTRSWKRVIFLNDKVGFVCGHGLFRTENAGIDWEIVWEQEGEQSWIVDMCLVLHESGYDMQDIWTVSSDAYIRDAINYSTATTQLGSSGASLQPMPESISVPVWGVGYGDIHEGLLSVDYRGIHKSYQLPGSMNPYTYSISFGDIIDWSFIDNRDNHHLGKSKGSWLTISYSSQSGTQHVAFPFKSYEDMLKFHAVFNVIRLQVLNSS